MNQKGIFGLAAVIVLAIAAVMIFKEADDGPLENAAEELDDAAKDIADEVN